MINLNSRLILALRILGLGLIAIGGVLSILATGGTSTGGDDAVTRRFDQYPLLLEIAGNGVFVPGEQRDMNLLADGYQVRRNPDFTIEASFGVDIAADSAVTVTPNPVVFDPPYFDPQGTLPNEFLLKAIRVQVPSGITNVQRFEIRATNPRSDITRAIFVVPAGVTYVAALTLAAQVAEAGTEVVGTVTISAPAPPGGTRVALRSSDSAASVPASVAIDAGLTTAQFTVSAIENTDPENGQSRARITASLNGTEQEAGLWIRQNTAFLLSLRPPPSLPNDSLTALGQLILSKPASSGDVLVNLSSENSLVGVPAAVTVAEGESTATFAVTLAQPVFERSAARLSGTYGGVTRTADVAFGITTSAHLKSVRMETSLGSNNDHCLVVPTQQFDPGLSPLIVELDNPAPPGYRIEVYSSNRRVLDLLTEIVAVGGETEFNLPVRPRFGEAWTDADSRERDLQRFIRIVARAVDTGQEVRSDLGVDLIGATEFISAEFAELVAPIIVVEPAGGGRILAGSVRNIFTHPFDAIPYFVRLQVPGFPDQTFQGAIPAGTEYGHFSVPVPAVSVATEGTLTANVDPCGFRDELVQSLPIVPVVGLLSGVSLGTPYIFAGESTQLTATIDAPAPAGGTQLLVVPSHSGVAVPLTLTIPEGASSASVTVTGLPVSVVTPLSIRVSVDNNEYRDVAVTVMPEPMSGDLTLTTTPSTLPGGQSSLLQARLVRSYPVPLLVALTTDNPSAATVPSTLQILANSTTAETAVNTTTVPAGTTLFATIRGTLRSIEAFAFLNITESSSSGDKALTLNIYGTGNGVVTYDPVQTGCTRTGGGAPTDCVRNYPAGTPVRLTAFAYDGFSVGDWVGCDSINQAGDQCLVTIYSDRLVQVYINAPAP